MATTATKQRILQDAVYSYSFDRMIYLNRDARKVFSVEFVDDHDEAELEALVNGPSSADREWRFYFNSIPSDAVKRELSALLA